MPNRILKESICTSDTINGLTAEEEVFFYRLLVNCDDYGRLDGRPSVIRSKCFPLRLDSVKDKDIQKWLQSLVRVGLIRLYNVDGKPYLHITTWDKHQQVRAKRSKYPAPDDGCEDVISDDISCQQPQSDDGICPRNPIQSESNPNPIRESIANTCASPSASTDEDTPSRKRGASPLSAIQEERFNAFWMAYPKKRSTGDAIKAWAKLKPDEELFERIMQGLERAKSSYDWQKDGGQYIPYPATWLNATGWEDEYTPPRPLAPPPRSPTTNTQRAIEAARRLLAKEATPDDP